MDPLSVTSGIVGIVAFALQLAKTAFKVKKAIEEVKSAPQEARDLVERLVMLETSCQLISFHLEQRQDPLNHSSPASLNVISQALAQCLPRVQRLEQMLSELTSSDDVAETSRYELYAVSRLRLLLRKGKISSLVQELDRVMSLLQFVIQVDMWTMTARSTQASLPSNNEIHPMGDLHKSEGTTSTTLGNTSSSQFTAARDIQRPTHQHCRSFRYTRYITWTIADVWIGDDHDANRIIHREGSITFRLPFTSTRLRMHYNSGMGAPSYALNVTHIIQEYSELGDRLKAAMSGDPERLHKLISGRELSLYSVFRTSSSEMNLLFMAVYVRWAEGCKYLLQHDFRHKLLQDEPPKVMRECVDGPSGKVCGVTETILSMRPYDMQETGFTYLLFTGTYPQYFTRYLKVFLKSPGIDPAVLLPEAWERLVVSIRINMHRLDDVFSWTPAFQYLIDQGVDIHQPLLGCPSAYVELLCGTVHPFEADEIASYWLKILEACGVDVSNYVKIESSIIEKNWHRNANQRGKKIVMRDFKGFQVPTWRWELFTESSIIEVLEKFQDFDSHDMEHILRPIIPAGPDDFRCWKADNFHTDLSRYCFPFLLSPIDCILRTGSFEWHDFGSREKYMRCRKTYDRAVELRDERFARRQAKKWRRAHLREVAPSNKMPGAWVD